VVFGIFLMVLAMLFFVEDAMSLRDIRPVFDASETAD
jgi:hypothetical protein